MSPEFQGYCLSDTEQCVKETTYNTYIFKNFPHFSILDN